MGDPWRGTVDAGPPARRRLLGLLAMRSGNAVPRDEIVDVLWGERPPKTCATLVHVHVAKLRALLRPQGTDGQTIAYSGGGYLLDPEQVRTDLAEFDRSSARARSALAAAEPARALDLFAEALRWWRGPVLADGGTRLRQHPDAVAAAQRRVAAAVSYADVALDLGCPGRVAAPLRALADEEPLHEGLHARLMLALAGAGERAAALRLYAEVRERLRDELGTEPGAGMRAAHLRLLRQEDVPIAPAADPERPRRPARLPADQAAFVGRRAHLRRLDAMLAPRPATHSTAVVVSGTAGVGKTDTGL